MSGRLLCVPPTDQPHCFQHSFPHVIAVIPRTSSLTSLNHQKLEMAESHLPRYLSPPGHLIPQSAVLGWSACMSWITEDLLSNVHCHGFWSFSGRKRSFPGHYHFLPEENLKPVPEKPLQPHEAIFHPLSQCTSISKWVNTHLLSTCCGPSIVLRAFSYLVFRHPCKARIMFSFIGSRGSLRTEVNFPKVTWQKEGSKISNPCVKTSDSKSAPHPTDW